jgi:hypothetical protein
VGRSRQVTATGLDPEGSCLERAHRSLLEKNRVCYGGCPQHSPAGAKAGMRIASRARRCIITDIS